MIWFVGDLIKQRAIRDYLNIIEVIDEQDGEYGNTLLISSVIKGSKSVVNMSVDAGAELNLQSDLGYTADFALLRQNEKI